MIIELRGVEFVNKGAELMLRAIIEKVKQEFPQALFVMERGQRTPEETLRKNGIYVKLNFRKYRINMARAGMLIPKGLRRNKGYILPGEINIVLDGSGFAFGDQWGAAYAEKRIGSQIIKWKQEGKKVILLPQAFGPFSEKPLISVLKKIIDNATLIFAREQQSCEYLKEISGTKENILLSPDFTNLIKGKIPSGFDKYGYDVAIIPNYKMIEKNSSENVYMNFLSEAIAAIRAQGLKPFFLIHEGERDVKIAELANSALTEALTIVRPSDPLEIKGIISVCRFIICSRFHGVVSALSQGIPCIVTSWSHKYEMLMQEYDYSDGLLKDLKDTGVLKSKIAELADGNTHSTIAGKLITNATIQKEKSAKMWDKVFQEIKA
jgi:polysaccharide pyruvyl transferase WcaK-like protein